MRPVVAVDLAAKFSAIVALGADSQVRQQYDSAGRTHRELSALIWETTSALHGLTGQSPVVVIEDLPPHVPSSTVAKTVAQLQGRIINTCPTAYLIDLYFVPPAAWERDMGVWRKETSEWEEIAAKLGYVPPDLLRHHGLVPRQAGKATAIKEALKQRTDYVAAYLIGRWAQWCMTENKTWDSRVVKQYLN